ncbi:putative ATP-dependent RNA helicase TDRD12 isoform X2 [Tribolium madens]|nr:putative ATP-dependent RNA helicase TDRD12 isoform X2 [Tribolium madens]
MEKQNIITKYIPAGVNVANSIREIEPKSKKGIRFDQIRESDICFPEEACNTKQENSSSKELQEIKTKLRDNLEVRNKSKEQQKLSLRKVIHKNSGLAIDNLNITVNENVVCPPNKELQKIKTKLTDNPEARNEQQKQSLRKVIHKNSGLTIDNFNITVNENVLFGKLPSEPHVEETNATPVSFKDIICERLRKSKKTKQNKIENSPSTIFDKFKKNKVEKLKEIEKTSPALKKQKCECNDCDKFVTCSFWLQNNVSFDEADNTNVTKGLPLLKSQPTEKEIAVLKTFNKIILHGVVIPKPLFSLDETNIDDNIQKALVRINCTSSKDIQSYMWPAIQRGLSTFMIAAPKSGKTLAYLPVFCTFAMEKNDRYAELAKYEGPLIIILCPNSKNCLDLHNLISALILDCWDAPVVEVLTENSPVQSNCDILVTVPSILEECLKAGKVSLKRLCHLAIEDGYFLLKNHNQSMEKLLKIINIAQTNRPHRKNVQIVVSSEKWSADLELLLKKLYITPIVCFEDFLEAAVYSKVEFKKKKLKSLHKLFYLDDVLKLHYMTQKAVVFCEEEEISNIKEHLEINGVECIMISNDLIEDEIFENEDMWRSLLKGQYKVFLCTDALFEKTARVLNANWVIHYSLPSNWAQFQKRFRCLVENLCSPFDVRDNIYKTNDKCSFLLIDEACDNQIFLDFFEVLTRNLVTHLQLK